MAAAAGSAGRKRREQQNAILRAQLKEKRRVLRERADEFFEELSADGEWLMDTQMETLLSKAMMKDETKLEPDAVRLVIDTARKGQEKAGMTAPQRGQLARAHAVDAVEKYGEYVKNAKAIDEVFQKYDKSHDGVLSKKELMRLIQDYERKARRTKKGMVVHLMVTDADVEWIIAESDADNNGTISHAEYLPAIAAWEELAQMKLNKPSKCVIL